GTIVDSSYVGVSTQYLVRMPWDQELTVFSQNDGTADPLRPGDAVELRWQPRHTFCLDGSGAIDAGVIIDDTAASAAGAKASV
ncbi:MAG: TOBE domain-containing protein, partial [Actinomycetota bacterium]|nr:TOBE domain-containing protein [Actinomycetota bacterium]